MVEPTFENQGVGLKERNRHHNSYEELSNRNSYYFIISYHLIICIQKINKESAEITKKMNFKQYQKILEKNKMLEFTIDFN